MASTQQTTVAPTTPGGAVSFGQRRRGRGRGSSRFGMQLKEKQNLKELYGISEEQLRRYYHEAQRRGTETGPTLVELLEQRLDNAVFRAEFAVTRRQARQMVSHRLFVVNGRPVNVPSLQLNVGDLVQVREGKRSKSYFSNFSKRMQNAHSPSWILLDVDSFGFKVTSLPTADEAVLGVDMQAVVELLAR